LIGCWIIAVFALIAVVLVSVIPDFVPTLGIILQNSAVFFRGQIRQKVVPFVWIAGFYFQWRMFLVGIAICRNRLIGVYGFILDWQVGV
jgi:hypothetical protein